MQLQPFCLSPDHHSPFPSLSLCLLILRSPLARDRPLPIAGDFINLPPTFTSPPPRNPIFFSRVAAIPGTFTGRRSNWRGEASITNGPPPPTPPHPLHPPPISFIPRACQIRERPYLTRCEHSLRGRGGLACRCLWFSFVLYAANTRAQTVNFSCISGSIFDLRGSTRLSLNLLIMGRQSMVAAGEKKRKIRGRVAACPDCDETRVS